MNIRPYCLIYVFISLSLFSLQSFACDSVFFDECLDGVGPAVTSSDNLRTTTFRISRSARHQNDEMTLTSAMSGQSAGDELTNWNIWGSYNGNDFNGDIPLVNAFDGLGNPVPLASYDADINSFMVGFDTLLNSQLVLGLAIGYEDGDIFTAYNGGNNESDGFTVTPYLAYLINETYSIDVSAGYSRLSYDTDRIDNTNGNSILGSFDSDRWFFASNLNIAKAYDKFFINGRIGYLYTEEEQDSYTETGGPTARTLGTRHIDLSQLIIGVDIAYSMGAFEPYIIASYLNDLSRDDGFSAGGLPGGVNFTVNDDDEIQSGIGVRYFGDGISGTLEWTKTFGRSFFDGDVIMATLRADL